MPDPGRPPEVSTLTSGELQRTRRELAASLALARPGSPVQAPIQAHLAAIDAELSARAAQHKPGHRPAASRTAPDPSPRNGGGHMPGPQASTGSDIEEVRGPLEYTRLLRLALDVFEEKMPPAYACDGLEAELWALREKIDAAEHARLRAIGHREYLIIKPLAPDTPGPRAARAAQAVTTLDDLGLVIRLV